MPIYHFHVYDDVGGALPDYTGTELPDVSAAALEAIRFAGMTISDDAVHGRHTREWSLEVTDHNGEALLSLEFMVRSASVVSGVPGPLRSAIQPFHSAAQ